MLLEGVGYRIRGTIYYGEGDRIVLYNNGPVTDPAVFDASEHNVLAV